VAIFYGVFCNLLTNNTIKVHRVLLIVNSLSLKMNSDTQTCVAEATLVLVESFCSACRFIFEKYRKLLNAVFYLRTNVYTLSLPICVLP
jgi:hypothetical protein